MRADDGKCCPGFSHAYCISSTFLSGLAEALFDSYLAISYFGYFTTRLIIKLLNLHTIYSSHSQY